MENQKEKKAEQAFKIDKDIKENEKKRRELFILNMLMLTDMYDKRFYELMLGDDNKKEWSGYLADIQIYYSRSKIERWRRIISKLVKELKLDINSFIDIPETRLDDVVDIIKRREKKENRKIEIKEVEELLSMARELIPLDWRNTIRESKGQETTNDCNHEYQVYRICKKCGWRQKVDIDNEQFQKEIQ